MLTAIKDFKKGSYELEWNSKKLDREAEDLVEKTKELQLLRVTKNLQEVLKRGAEAQSSPQEQVGQQLLAAYVNCQFQENAAVASDRWLLKLSQGNLEALLKYNAVIHNKNLMDKQNKLYKLQVRLRKYEQS